MPSDAIRAPQMSFAHTAAIYSRIDLVGQPSCLFPRQSGSSGAASWPDR